jgi:hypothetical protein
MPGFTPELGLPYAQGPDFAIDYPETVDEPRALMIDNMLQSVGAIASGSLPAGSALASGWHFISLTTQLAAWGGATVGAGAIYVGRAGWYQIGLWGSFNYTNDSWYFACSQVLNMAAGHPIQPRLSITGPVPTTRLAAGTYNDALASTEMLVDEHGMNIPTGINNGVTATMSATYLHA